MTQRDDEWLRKMAARLDTSVEEVRTMYEIADKVMEEHGIDFDELCQIVSECYEEAQAFGLDVREYIKLVQRYGGGTA